MSAVRSEGRADELVRRAHARVYRFPAGFAGFSARLVWETDAARGEGDVEVRPGTEEPVALHGLDESPEWVGRELRSIVAHRSHRTYDGGDGALRKEVADDGPLGTRVELDDELDSSYVIGDGQIALVSRAHGSQRFTIAIQHRTDAGDGTHVPTAFTVAFWDDASRLVASEAYADAYADLDGVLVPAVRTIVRADDDGLGVRRILLTDHRSLS